MFENPVEYIHTHLSEEFTIGEIRAFTTLILKEVCNLSFSDIVACKFTELSDNEKQNIISIVKRLQNGEPIQYILGVTEFYGLDFKVTSSVLIPRPETEELIELIRNDYNPETELSLIDLGTGSGCIPISLAKLFPNSNVSAIDISEKALEVAQSNAQNLNVKIDFYQQNLLEDIQLNQKFDVIVSNPPYIRNLEKEEMHQNVLNFEPHLALFVENENALIFYERVLVFAENHLNQNGTIYCEINQYLGQETKQLFEKNYEFVTIYKDISGNDRMLKASKTQ